MPAPVRIDSMEPLRILYISSEYPPETGFGGIGTYTRHMAEAMAARGHGVAVISRSASGEESCAMVNGVSVHRIGAGAYPLPEGRWWYPLRRACYATIPESLAKLAWAREVRRAHDRLSAESGPFDIVEYPECGGEGALLLRPRHGALVARLHTPWQMIRAIDGITEPPLDRWLQNRLERSSVRKAAMVTAPSRALGDRIRRRWRLRAVQQHGNPLPCDRYMPATGEDGWLCVGRVERVKGTHVLIDAYAALGVQNPPPLLLLGRPYGALSDGTRYGDFIREKIRRHQLSDRVRWIEGVPHDEVLDHLARASAVIVPSLWENCPYSCLEAMACGIPVVASRAGGLPELLQHEKTGLLFEAGSPESLASVLRRLISNPELGRSIGAAARSSVRERFDSSTIAAEVDALYRGLLIPARQGRPENPAHTKEPAHG